jgi:hypothetical protein
MNDSHKDIIRYIDSIPFGEVSLKVVRVNRKTTVVITTGEETLKYEDNDEALKDIDNMLKSLVEVGYTGDAHVKLSMKDGKIKLVSIFNKKETKYS